MKIDISNISDDNKGEARIKNDQWIELYNEYYGMFFANMTSGIKMDGFRKGTIPSVLLELKYPTLLSSANEKSMFAIIQNIYEELKKNHSNIKLDNYILDEQTKDLIIFFHLEDKNNQDIKNTESDIIQESKEKIKKNKSSKTKEKKQ